MIGEDFHDSLRVLGDTRQSIEKPAVTDGTLLSSRRLDTILAKQRAAVVKFQRSLEGFNALSETLEIFASVYVVLSPSFEVVLPVEHV